MTFNLKVRCTPDLNEASWNELVEAFINELKGVYDMEDGSQTSVEVECVESIEEVRI